MENWRIGEVGIGHFIRFQERMKFCWLHLTVLFAVTKHDLKKGKFLYQFVLGRYRKGSLSAWICLQVVVKMLTRSFYNRG